MELELAMTITNSQPRNGARQRVPSERVDADSPPSVEVESLRQQLAETQERVSLQRHISDVEAGAAFTSPRDEQDQQAANRIRAMQRIEDERSARASIRAQRTTRWRSWWDDRAERVRERVLDPARAVGTIHRTWTAVATVIMVLICGALLYLTNTVKVGVVGLDGSVLGYAIEPMASAMLVVSLVIQTLGRRQGVAISRGFIAVDVALCAASMVLVTVPWGMRFGFDLSTTMVHLIIPGLVALAVTVWHLSATTTADLIARTKRDPVLVERLSMLRNAIGSGELPPEPSKTRIEKFLRERLGSISRADAHRVARNLLGE